jgi:hypothetical protein
MAVWSLGYTLASLVRNLPASFHASQGVRSLFPEGFKGSIKTLDRYVFAVYQPIIYSVADTDVIEGGEIYTLIRTLGWSLGANAYLMADGTGRWFFSWSWWPVGNDMPPPRNQAPGAGFTFLSPDNGSAHVFVAPGEAVLPNQKSCSSGVDSWIAENWPNVFQAGAKISLYGPPSGPAQDPVPSSQVWTGVGFAANKFINLNGASSTCAATLSGSTLFTFPAAPVGLVSPLGALLPPLLTVLGQALAIKASRVKSNQTIAGVAYAFSPPQGASNQMTLSFNEPGGCSGSITWTLANGAIKASAQVPLKISGITGELSYDLDLAGAGSGQPNGKLTSKVQVQLPGNATSVLQTTSINGQIVSQNLVNTAAGGSSKTFAFAGSPTGVTVNGSAGLATIAAAVAAQPVTQGQLLDPGTLPISIFMSGLPNSGIWPGDTVIAESWNEDGWTQTPTGETLTFTSKWGFGLTDYGLAQYNISVTIDSSGAVTSYGIVGQLQNGPGGVNGIISCNVDQVANTTTCFEDLQIPVAQSTGSAFPSNVGPDATVGMNLTSTKEADGSITWSYNGSIANPDGTSSGVSGKSLGAVSANVTDADGNKSTADITPNPDGTSTITISTTDKDGNGTYEVIEVDPQGNLISDTTTPVGDVASGDDSGGDDEGTGEEGEEGSGGE